MPTFKNLAQVEKYYREVMEDIIRNELRKTITDVWLEEQEKRVYNVYEPSEYERRDEGGLSDPDNIHMMVEEGTNRIMATLVNVTKGNPSNSGKRDTDTSHFPLKDSEYLNPYIESQSEFDRKKGGGFLSPRPYTEFAVESLIQGVDRQAMLKAINDGLKRHGLIAKIK